ncbi:hypothetical protein [Nocardia tengchongensis]|uniref:hypothetical protein n=1 Tax=Nocardia tengchongensis TaxID=2055889 RepID=UPI003623B9E6
MSPKSLVCKGIGVVAAAAAIVSAVGAGPATADIISTAVTCPSGEMIGPCNETQIVVDTTDANPVWITLNGTELPGSPFTPVAFTQTSGAIIHTTQVLLDCIRTPLHVVAVQKNSAGVITSQMSADYTPAPTSTGSALNNLLTGSGNQTTTSPDAACNIIRHT